MKTEKTIDYSTAEYKKWRKEKELIPVMIRKYCHGHHGTKGSDICEDCQKLVEYAMFRLDKCPFKKDKHFCSCCSIRCYKPEEKAKIKEVMRYSGPRMLTCNPIFACSHVIEMLKYKRSLKNASSDTDGKEYTTN